MLLSTLIQTLTELHVKHGDLDVSVYDMETGDSSSVYSAEYAGLLDNVGHITLSFDPLDNSVEDTETDETED